MRVVVKGEKKQLQLSELYVIGTAAQAQNAFVGMYSNKIHNLSIFGQGVASSTFGDMTPNLINDNNVNGNLFMKSIARTKVSKDPYLGVKFDWPMKCAGITIFPEMSEREKLIEEASIECYNSKGEKIFDKELKDIISRAEERVILPF